MCCPCRLAGAGNTPVRFADPPKIGPSVNLATGTHTGALQIRSGALGKVVAIAGAGLSTTGRKLDSRGLYRSAGETAVCH
ncbi:MAG: hypothetical protein CMJ59_01800 [Planctomycetaceae bacterium]|nr:hypothetical protein [Planctomycetaceae bacterium]